VPVLFYLTVERFRQTQHPLLAFSISHRSVQASRHNHNCAEATQPPLRARHTTAL
jgi:hypothetical protein